MSMTKCGILTDTLLSLAAWSNMQFSANTGSGFLGNLTKLICITGRAVVSWSKHSKMFPAPLVVVTVCVWRCKPLFLTALHAQSRPARAKLGLISSSSSLDGFIAPLPCILQLLIYGCCTIALCTLPLHQLCDKYGTDKKGYPNGDRTSCVITSVSQTFCDVFSRCHQLFPRYLPLNGFLNIWLEGGPFIINSTPSDCILYLPQFLGTATDILLDGFLYQYSTWKFSEVAGFLNQTNWMQSGCHQLLQVIP